MRRKIKISFLVFFAILGLFLVFLLTYIQADARFIMPVKNASRNDYSQQSMGSPRVGHKHQGSDIFAKKGTPVLSSTRGIVIYKGVLKLGGKVVLVLGPGFKMYYYAHLDTIMTHKLSLLQVGEPIGKVGNTGNAMSTPAHLHFSIRNFFPYKSGSYEDPVPFLNRASRN
jgi:murein DD-endopeptidase MepM/ murein hydrolase activator NlpD